MQTNICFYYVDSTPSAIVPKLEIIFFSVASVQEMPLINAVYALKASCGLCTFM